MRPQLPHALPGPEVRDDKSLVRRRGVQERREQGPLEVKYRRLVVALKEAIVRVWRIRLP